MRRPRVAITARRVLGPWYLALFRQELRSQRGAGVDQRCDAVADVGGGETEPTSTARGVDRQKVKMSVVECVRRQLHVEEGTTGGTQRIVVDTRTICCAYGSLKPVSAINLLPQAG
jgi:hypothetical protein